MFNKNQTINTKTKDFIQALLDTEEVKAYKKAQATLQTLVADLVDDISQEINFPFVKPQRGGLLRINI